MMTGGKGSWAIGVLNPEQWEQEMFHLRTGFQPEIEAILRLVCEGAATGGISSRDIESGG
jgi:hypothetical protein